jgi:hypothetical protein
MAHHLVISEVVGIVGDHVALADLFIVGDGVVRGVVVLLQMVFLYVVFVVLIRFAAGHEPDGHQYVKCNYDEQINSQHEKSRLVRLVMDSHGTANQWQNIKYNTHYCQVMHRC